METCFILLCLAPQIEGWQSLWMFTSLGYQLCMSLEACISLYAFLIVSSATSSSTTIAVSANPYYLQLNPSRTQKKSQFKGSSICNDWRKIMIGQFSVSFSKITDMQCKWLKAERLYEQWLPRPRWILVPHQYLWSFQELLNRLHCLIFHAMIRTEPSNKFTSMQSPSINLHMLLYSPCSSILFSFPETPAVALLISLKVLGDLLSADNEQASSQYNV